jgi:hypothetical protein
VTEGARLWEILLITSRLFSAFCVAESKTNIANEKRKLVDVGQDLGDRDIGAYIFGDPFLIVIRTGLKGI